MRRRDLLLQSFGPFRPTLCSELSQIDSIVTVVTDRQVAVPVTAKSDDFRLAVIHMKLSIDDGIPVMIPISGKIADSLDFLFIGSAGAAYNRSNLTTAGITHILCLTDLVRCNYPSNFQYHRSTFNDDSSSDLNHVFEDCFQFIELARTARGKVLVHCYQGKSRSTAICCGYLMKYFYLTLPESLRRIQSVREICQPNDHFMGQLRAFEASLKC